MEGEQMPTDGEGTSAEREDATAQEESVPIDSLDQDAQPPPSKKSKQSKQDNQKRIWLITYASGSPDITLEMLHSNNVKCDEYYTITWRESKYTLIHLNQHNKIRRSTLIKTMNALLKEFGVKESMVTGYESLSSNNEEEKIQDHPGFKRMVELLNNNKEEIKIWIENGDLMTYRKGLLWKFIRVEDPKNKTRTQLLMQVREWTPIVLEVSDLRSQNELLQQTLASKNEELSSLYTNLTKKNQTIMGLRRKLIQAGLDPSLEEPF